MSSNLSNSDPPLSKKPRGPYRQTMKPSRQTRYNWRKRAERQVVASGNEPSDSQGVTALTVPPDWVHEVPEELPACSGQGDAEDISTDSVCYTCGDSGDYESTDEPIEGIALMHL